MVGSDVGGFRASPPVVECGEAFQARAVEEPAPLPDGSEVAEMPGDHAVTRARAARIP